MSVPNPATTDWVPVFAGPGGLTYEGDYVAATTYQDGDIVVFQGIAYLCVGGPTTVAPSPTPWGLGVVSSAGYGITLPASPVNGQEHILVDSLTAPTYIWRFRYNASSASAYKWEFIGGAPKFVGPLGNETTTSTATTDLATIGPSFIIPRTGEYRFGIGTNVYNSVATYNVIELWIGAAAATGLAAMASPTAAGYADAYRTVHAAMTAGNEARMRYRCGGGTFSASARTLEILPVRIS